MFFLLLLATLLGSPAMSQDADNASDNSTVGSSRLPAFVSLIPNINDFTRFADGGPHEDWYVGFNNAWIVKLPPVPSGEYTRAFVGARLGRAKTRPRAGRGWDREAIPGKIYMAISQTPAFSSEQSFFLVETFDIPLEPDPRVSVTGTGQSQWFWTEIPIGLVSSSAPNYLIVWSPTEDFTSAATAPILAAAAYHAGPGEEQAWLNRTIQGVPPRNAEGSLQTPITSLAPALAIKLIPVNDAAVGINECSATPQSKAVLFQFSVDAENTQTAWVEASSDKLEWRRITRFQREPPYFFTIPTERVPSKGGYLRGAGQDMLGNIGYCDPVFVSRQR